MHGVRQGGALRRAAGNTTTVLTGGRVYDRTRRLTGEVRDVAIRNGVVQAVDEGLPRAGARVVDCTGSLVTPGLIDVHTHVFAPVSRGGIDPLAGQFRRGVVAVVDAGSAGASTYPAFQRFVVDRFPGQVFAWLNASAIGIVDGRFGELLNPKAFVQSEMEATVASAPRVIKGLKIRISDYVIGRDFRPLLERVVESADRLGVPIMVHVGSTGAELGEALSLLRAGDVVTHCYTPNRHGIFADDVLENGIDTTVLEARDRGVLFDVGHGTTQWSWEVARSAIRHGFLPDLVGSDLSSNNWYGPAYDLPTVMSKLVAAGMGVADVVDAVTRRAAHAARIVDEGFGSITVGGPAYLSVLSWTDPVALTDHEGITVEAPRLEPTLTIAASRELDVATWRGEPEALRR